ncbi:glycosyl hydrolase family 28-related protein [Microbacterium sp. NPDC019599]|uniref:glycosyl hydrolase family 28-related protein n=1 Tax=Microbacterium sp. NPDC019599 TaxID=3154690 RepID=UPI0033FCEB32
MTRPRTLIAAAAAASLTLAALAAAAPASAAKPAPPPPPVVTRAALDPALVAGRGAEVAFLEQEAENAVTNGTIIGPSREAYSLEAEASGRKAVRLAPGQFVEFTLPAAANAITVRYSIPDASGGGGLTAPLKVTAGGKKHTLELTSQYAYLYNQYPFTNDPDAGLLHPDWWITECGCVPGPGYEPAKPFRPMKFYDEERLLLGKTYKAGDTIRLTAPASVAWTVIDLIDTEKVAAPYVKIKAANVLLFGADPTGRRDSASALEKAIAFAQRKGLTVYVPPGTYRVDRHIVVDDVTIEGAGSWYTTFKGSEVALEAPAPDGSVHTGVGFYGKDAAEGGSSDVHLSGFSIEGDVRERIDTDQVNGIGGAFSDSSFTNLHIQHTKVGIWLDGPMSGVTIADNVIVDQIADGVNLHLGVTDSVVRNNFVRNSGDDGLAAWAEQKGDAPTNARNTFDRNTVQTPNLANGIAIYGGTDTTVSGNLVADTIREGSALHAGSRFGAHAFDGSLTFSGNTTVRAGTRELNWDIGLGSIWFYVLDKSIDADIHVVGDHYLDSTYNAILMVSDWGIKDQYTLTGVHFEDIRVDGVGTSVVSARVKGGASFENVDVRGVGWWGVNNCGSFDDPTYTHTSFFSTDLGGNDGVDSNEWHPGTNWLGYYLPNPYTCNDRPPVVAPPAPSTWVQPVG